MARRGLDGRLAEDQAAATKIQSVYRGRAARARAAEARAIRRQQGFSSIRPRGVAEVQVSAD